MRILIAHNAYKHKGGEDSVVETEIELLRQNGHEVDVFLKHNDETDNMSRLSLAANTFWSTRSVKEIRRLISAKRPDVIHVHNTLPIISPAIYWIADKENIPIVQTLHNFRLMCPQAMFLRNNQICEDCLGNTPWRAIPRRCYRNSVAQSTVLAGMVTAHRIMGTWRNKVTRYIALNEFCKKLFIAGGLPPERVVVKPNFVDFAPPPHAARSSFLFVGRLSIEKGIDTLAKAALMAKTCSIRVAGTGPEASALRLSPNINPLGGLSGNEVREQMTTSKALILPSIWYENFPRTLVEAFACGLPVIASRLGALAELVEDGVTGLLFEPGNAEDLARKLRWADEHPAELSVMGGNARAHYEANFTADINYRQLVSIYSEAIAEAAEK